MRPTHGADGQAPEDAEGTPVNITMTTSDSRQTKKNTVGSLLSGGILSRKEVRRAYPFMLFVVALMFFYIANAFRTQSLYRRHAELTAQVKELRSKSMTVASEKMQVTRLSYLLGELERRGMPLRESLTPNKVIPTNNHAQTAADDR